MKRKSKYTRKNICKNCLFFANRKIRPECRYKSPKQIEDEIGYFIGTWPVTHANDTCKKYISRECLDIKK